MTLRRSGQGLWLNWDALDLTDGHEPVSFQTVPF